MPIVTAKLEEKTCLPGWLFWPTLLLLLINLAIAAKHTLKFLRKQRRSVSMGKQGVEMRLKKESIGATFTAMDVTNVVKIAKVGEDAGICVEKVEALNVTRDKTREKKITNSLDSVAIKKERDLESSLITKDGNDKITKDDSLESLTNEIFDSLIAMEGGDLKIMELLNDEQMNKKASMVMDTFDAVIAIEDGNLKNVEPVKNDEALGLALEKSFDQVIAGEKNSKDCSVIEINTSVSV